MSFLQTILDDMRSTISSHGADIRHLVDDVTRNQSALAQQMENNKNRTLDTGNVIY